MAHSRAKREIMGKMTKKNVEGSDADGKWIQRAIKHPGALHKTLGVPEGKKIPEKKLQKASHSKDPITKKRAILAETLRNFKRK